MVHMYIAALVAEQASWRALFWLTNAASIMVGMAMYAQALIVPQLLQLPKATGYGLGTSMLITLTIPIRPATGSAKAVTPEPVPAAAR